MLSIGGLASLPTARDMLGCVDIGDIDIQVGRYEPRFQLLCVLYI